MTFDRAIDDAILRNARCAESLQTQSLHQFAVSISRVRLRSVLILSECVWDGCNNDENKSMAQCGRHMILQSITNGTHNTHAAHNYFMIL